MITGMHSQIQRFFGPVSEPMAAEISEALINDAAFLKSLHEFLAGEIEPRQFVYELQVLAEGIEEELLRDGVCGLDAYKREREARGA